MNETIKAILTQLLILLIIINSMALVANTKLSIQDHKELNARTALLEKSVLGLDARVLGLEKVVLNLTNQILAFAEVYHDMVETGNPWFDAQSAVPIIMMCIRCHNQVVE